MGAWVAETFARYRGHLGPPGPKLEKSRKMSSRGLSPPGPKKSKTRSRKRVKIDCFSTILTLFRLRFRLFGPRGREVPGTPLSFLSSIFLFYQGKTLKLTKDFCPLPNPLKPWKKQRKGTDNQRNSLLKINQGIQKKTTLRTLSY